MEMVKRTCVSVSLSQCPGIHIHLFVTFSVLFMRLNFSVFFPSLSLALVFLYLCAHIFYESSVIRLAVCAVEYPLLRTLTLTLVKQAIVWLNSFVSCTSLVSLVFFFCRWVSFLWILFFSVSHTHTEFFSWVYKTAYQLQCTFHFELFCLF